MPKALDLSGQRFQRLTAISRTETRGQAFWRCRCDCGNEIIAATSNLRSGNTKSCGCLKIEWGMTERNAMLIRTKSGVRMCPNCNTEKPRADFYVNSKRSFGVSTYCKSCEQDRAYVYRYGISKEEVSAFISQQGGLCANRGCGRDISISKGSHLDHCHKTDKIRGVLCRSCNLALGLLEDNKNRIAGLVDYLG